MMGALTVRSATLADLPAIGPMVAKTCAFHQGLAPAKYAFVPEPEKRYGRWLETQVDQPRSVFLIAEVDGRAAGFLIATVEPEIPIYRLGEFAFLHDLWVEETARGRGAGQALMTEMIARFRALGVEQIRLDVVADNRPAERLFAGCGFAVATKQMICVLKKPAGEAPAAGMIGTFNP